MKTSTTSVLDNLLDRLKFAEKQQNLAQADGNSDYHYWSGVIVGLKMAGDLVTKKEKGTK